MSDRSPNSTVQVEVLTRVHCVVFSYRTLNSHSTSLCPVVQRGSIELLGQPNEIKMLGELSCDGLASHPRGRGGHSVQCSKSWLHHASETKISSCFLRPVTSTRVYAHLMFGLSCMLQLSYMYNPISLNLYAL